MALRPGAAVAGPAGDQLDLEIDLTIPTGGVAHLVLLASPDRAEQTILEMRRDHDQIAPVWLDRSRSSARSRRLGHRPHWSDPRGSRRHDRAQVLLDHSALEMFINGQPLTARAYPTQTDALHTAVTVPAHQGKDRRASSA